MYAQDQAAKLRKLIANVQNARSSPRVIAITSGKGGTGKSVLAVNLAVAFRRQGKRVLLIDADFGLANVDLMLGASSQKDLSHVLSGEVSAAEAVQVGPEGVRFLSGGSGVQALLNMDVVSASTMVSRLLQLETDTDMILLDTGAGVTPVVLRLLTAANEAIIITTPEPTAIMDAYALIKTLSFQSRRPAMRLVINRVETRREAYEAPEAIIALVRKNMSIAVDLLGTISNDPLVPQTIKKQVPILVAHPFAPASRDIGVIANKLLGLPTENSGGGFSIFLQRLLNIRT